MGPLRYTHTKNNSTYKRMNNKNQRLPNGIWNDNSHKATRKLMHLDCWISDYKILQESSFHGCWLAIVVVWRLWREQHSETGRIRFRSFRRARFQTPSSVSFFGLTEFRAESSASSSQPIICVPKRTYRVLRRTHRVCPRTRWVPSSETVLSKQYSARFLNIGLSIMARCRTRRFTVVIVLAHGEVGL